MHDPQEALAVQAALRGGWWARTRLALRAGWHLLRNPDDTKQVFTLGIALNAHRIDALLGRFVAEGEGLALASEDASIDSHSIDLDRLRALGPDTLGGAYARFLDDNGLDPDLFQAPPG